MWVEHLAQTASDSEPYSFPFSGEELDFRPLLESLARDRCRGRDPAACARALQRGIAHGLCDAVAVLCETLGLDTVVLSGRVFQNELLLRDIKSIIARERIRVWTNYSVPPNDGGISLGQAALAAFADRSGIR